MELRKKILMTLKDYIDFNLFVSRKTRIVSSFVFLPIFPLLYYINNDDYDIISFAVSVSISLILSALILWLQYLLLKRAAKKQYESNSMMKSETDVLINSTGINESSKYGSTSVEWPDLYKVDESEKAIFLYIGKAQAFIIPKRLLTTEELASVYTLIKEHIAPGKYRLLKKS